MTTPLYAKFDGPVALQNLSLVASAHDCEIGLFFFAETSYMYKGIIVALTFLFYSLFVWPLVLLILPQFRYASRLDVLLMILGTLGAIGHGAATPLQFIIFGELINGFIDFAKEQAGNGTTEPFDLEGEMAKFALYYVYLAIGTIVVGYLQMGLWAYTGTRQVKQMRLAFFRSVLKQDIGWFDTTDSGELSSRLTE